MTLWVGLTHPALTKLTFMDYLLTMLRNLLRRKHGCDNFMLYCILYNPESRANGNANWALLLTSEGAFAPPLQNGW